MPPAAPGAPEAGQGDARVYGATSGQSRIQIRATQDSWIQVRDGTGDLLMTRVLRPGDVYRVPDKAGLKMQTGNAGGLQVSVDGGQGTAMGTPGQVLRGVPLDPERWAGAVSFALDRALKPGWHPGLALDRGHGRPHFRGTWNRAPLESKACS